MFQNIPWTTTTKRYEKQQSKTRLGAFIFKNTFLGYIIATLNCRPLNSTFFLYSTKLQQNPLKINWIDYISYHNSSDMWYRKIHTHAYNKRHSTGPENVKVI